MSRDFCGFGMALACKINMATKHTDYDVPDDPELLRAVEAATGYLELSMPCEAIAEIEALPVEYGNLSIVLHLRLVSLICLKRFEEAASGSLEAVRLYPGVAEFYIHGGAALTALDRGEDARRLWRSAPRSLQKTGYFHFNVAWCELEIGNEFVARQHLERAIALDPEVRAYANECPRLSGLLGYLN